MKLTRDDLRLAALMMFLVGSALGLGLSLGDVSNVATDVVWSLTGFLVGLVYAASFYGSTGRGREG